MKLASHNSLSFVKPKKWWEKLINFTSKCQSHDIQTQYTNGVRLFDIRLRRDWISCYSREYDAIAAHGLVEYRDIIIPDVLDYLNENQQKMIQYTYN